MLIIAFLKTKIPSNIVYVCILPFIPKYAITDKSLLNQKYMNMTIRTIRELDIILPFCIVNSFDYLDNDVFEYDSHDMFVTIFYRETNNNYIIIYK